MNNATNTPYLLCEKRHKAILIQISIFKNMIADIFIKSKYVLK